MFFGKKGLSCLSSRTEVAYRGGVVGGFFGDDDGRVDGCRVFLFGCWRSFCCHNGGSVTLFTGTAVVVIVFGVVVRDFFVFIANNIINLSGKFIRNPLLTK